MEPMQLISFALILTGVYLVGREMGRRAAQRTMLRDFSRLFVAYRAEQMTHDPGCPLHEAAEARIYPNWTADLIDKADKARKPVIVHGSPGPLFDEPDPVSATVRRTRENDERVYGRSRIGGGGE